MRRRTVSALLRVARGGWRWVWVGGGGWRGRPCAAGSGLVASEHVVQACGAWSRGRSLRGAQAVPTTVLSWQRRRGPACGRDTVCLRGPSGRLAAAGRRWGCGSWWGARCWGGGLRAVAHRSCGCAPVHRSRRMRTGVSPAYGQAGRKKLVVSARRAVGGPWAA